MYYFATKKKYSFKPNANVKISLCVKFNIANLKAIIDLFKSAHTTYTDTAHLFAKIFVNTHRLYGKWCKVVLLTIFRWNSLLIRSTRYAIEWRQQSVIYCYLVNIKRCIQKYRKIARIFPFSECQYSGYYQKCFRLAALLILLKTVKFCT